MVAAGGRNSGWAWAGAAGGEGAAKGAWRRRWIEELPHWVPASTLRLLCVCVCVCVCIYVEI